MGLVTDRRCNSPVPVTEDWINVMIISLNVEKIGREVKRVNQLTECLSVGSSVNG